MTRFVLDASVALRWVLDDPVPAYAKRIQQLMLAGARPLVPALWHLEMASGLRVSERRQLLTPAELEQALLDIEKFLNYVETEMALLSVRQSLAMSRVFQLTPYDAAYLDAAQRHRLPLATLDADLRAAALKAGTPIFR